jgi:hypothetical protein
VIIIGILKWWRKFIRKLKKTPHLFSKVIVVWCIICGTVFSVIAILMLYKTGLDASNLLLPILGFFGGELALLFGKTAVSNKYEKTQDEYVDEEEYE